MLRDRVEDFIASGSCPDEFYGLLSQCVADGTLEGLACARRLYESDYGGFTDLYDYQLRAPAAATLVIWGEAGIQALLDGARANPGSKNFSLCVQLLSSIAAASALPPLSFVRDHALAEKIETARRAAPHLSEFCRTRLVEFVLSIELDDDVAEHIGGSIARPNLDMPAAKEVFAALSTRWLAVSTPVLKRYEALKSSSNLTTSKPFNASLLNTRNCSIRWLCRFGRNPISLDLVFLISLYAAPTIVT
jgi:hypothetical protein